MGSHKELQRVVMLCHSSSLYTFSAKDASIVTMASGFMINTCSIFIFSIPANPPETHLTGFIPPAIRINSPCREFSHAVFSPSFILVFQSVRRSIRGSVHGIDIAKHLQDPSFESMDHTQALQGSWYRYAPQGYPDLAEQHAHSSNIGI